eukprot:1709423-Pyramimonas_sp.AAC.1
MEGVGAKAKAKSRWCVHGHEDPDGEHLSVYPPTPQTESILVALQVIASMNWVLNIADAKNSFCQSNRLERPNGAIYVEPCSGLSLPVGSLIELVAPVYGFDDAPLLWHRALTDFLSSL